MKKRYVVGAVALLFVSAAAIAYDMRESLGRVIALPKPFTDDFADLAGGVMKRIVQEDGGALTYIINFSTNAVVVKDQADLVRNRMSLDDAQRAGLVDIGDARTKACAELRARPAEGRYPLQCD